MSSMLDVYDLYRVEVRPKSDWGKWWKMPLRRWWHLAIPLFWWVVGIFKPKLKRKFYSKYWTTINKTVYCPDARYESVLEHPDKYKPVLRHEFVHVMDMLVDGRLKYSLKYLLTKKGRAYYERRAYTQQMIVAFERMGYVPDILIDWIVEQFEGPMYWYMDPDARPKIEQIRDKVERGEYQGYYPNVQ